MRLKTNPLAAEPEESPGSVPALDRTLDILELLSSTPDGLSLAQLSTHFGFPKNAVFRITQTLLARGYLVRDDQSMKFQLTPKLLRLAPPRWGNLSLPELARESMTQLRDETGETVQLGVLNGTEGVIIDQVEGLMPLRITVDLGLRFPLYNNAPGKLLLAHLPQEQREATLAKIKLESCTPRTIISRPAMRREFERIVSAGYSVDHAEADEGIHCVAAPIFSSDDRVVGAIWISGPSKRMPKSRFRELGAQVSSAGVRVSRLIGEMA
jgi:DNA-binding IclR family transcriptional regulator